MQYLMDKDFFYVNYSYLMLLYICLLNSETFCLEVICRTPAFEQKEIIIQPNETDHKYNKTIKIKCKQGFSLKGSQKATCHQNASFYFIDGTPLCEGNALFLFKLV